MGAIAEDVFKSGSLTAAATDSTGVLEMANPGMSTVMVQLTGTWTATVAFEVNVDQGSSPSWVAVNAQNVNTGAQVSSATTNGIFKVDVSAAREFRVHCTAFTSGPIVVSMNGSVATTSAGLGTGSGGGSVVDTELSAAVAFDGNNGNAAGTEAKILAYQHVYDATNSNFKAVRSVNNIGDAVAGGTIAPAAGMVFNGTNWDRMRGTTNGAQVQGAAAHATPLAGNPVLCAGSDGTNAANFIVASPLADASSPGGLVRSQAIGYTFNGSTWDRLRSSNGDAQAGTGLPAAANMMWNGTGWDRWRSAAAVSDGSTASIGAVTQFSFNGTNWDRWRGNLEGTALASAARTTTTNSADIINYNAAGVRVFINVTATAATPSITIAIQEKDPVSGNYIDILVSAAITTTGQKATLVCYPGALTTANVSTPQPLPRTWRINATHSDADSITYSVSYSYIL